MHFQTSGYLPALRDLILSARFADRMALHGFECMHVISQRDSHHWTLATLTGTVLLRDK